MHAQSAGEPKRSDLRLLGAFMHAQSAGEPKRSDLRLLGAFMHAQSAGEPKRSDLRLLGESLCMRKSAGEPKMIQQCHMLNIFIIPPRLLLYSSILLKIKA